MKFISLVQKEHRSSYEAILMFGCGPNFVLNRELLFRNMIAEQGTTFWFRFWLTFCFQPGCQYMKSLEEQSPNLVHRLYIGLHKSFLEVSADESSTNCVNIIKSMTKHADDMLPLSTENDNIYKTLHPSLVEMTSRCVKMAFGAALCEVFYKWLTAAETDEKWECVWKIPKEYLRSKFQPRLLERYCSQMWEENLFALLGITAERIRWPVDFSHEYQKNLNAELTNTTRYNENTYQIVQALVMATKRWLTSIHLLDEINTNKYSETVEVDSHLAFDEQSTLMHDIEKMKNKVHKCANCKSARSKYKSFLMCRKCRHEKWQQPRYYCDINCEIEHWFKCHEKEHREFTAEWLEFRCKAIHGKKTYVK